MLFRSGCAFGRTALHHIERCPIVDTWWQTETGACMMSPLPGAHALKPGSAARPFFGVVPGLVDNLGNLIEGAAEGNLVILDSWPGQARTLYGDHDRFVDTYFKTFRGMYFTGDGARRDEDGYYWITGTVLDDVPSPFKSGVNVGVPGMGSICRWITPRNANNLASPSAVFKRSSTASRLRALPELGLAQWSPAGRYRVGRLCPDRRSGEQSLRHGACRPLPARHGNCPA